jgi:hypothetical protein
MDVTGSVELVGVEWTLLLYVSDGVESVPGDYPLEITLGITHRSFLGDRWVQLAVRVGRRAPGFAGLPAVAAGGSSDRCERPRGLP